MKTIQQAAIDTFNELDTNTLLELGSYAVFQPNSSGPVVVHQFTGTENESGVFKHYANIELAISSIPEENLFSDTGIVMRFTNETKN